MSVLTVASGAIDHRTTVRMKRHRPWVEGPRLWTALVSDSSGGKTPPMDQAAGPLEARGHEIWRDHQAQLETYEFSKETGGKNARKPPEPAESVIYNTTTEKLGDVASRNLRGLLVKADELGGLIGSIDRYGSGSKGGSVDAAIWNKAYDGGPYAFHRMSRPSVHIENLSCSVLGGLQPKLLAEVKDLTDIGFLPAMINEMDEGKDEPRGTGADIAYAELIDDLWSAPYRQFAFTDTAQTMMRDLQHDLHQAKRDAEGGPDGWQSFIGKLRGVAGRLSLVLQMTSNPAYEFNSIDAPVVRAVRTLIEDFIIPHGWEFYFHAFNGGGSKIKLIASYILTRQNPSEVLTARELIRNVAPLRSVGSRNLNIELRLMVDGGWLEPIEDELSNRAWKVNWPAIAPQFSMKKAEEEARKRRIVQRLDALKTRCRGTTG